MISTSCEKCEFKVVDDNKNQTDCAVGRINLYSQMGGIVRSEGDPSYFIINGKVCSYCRNIEANWGDGLSLEEKIVKAREEITIKLHVIIPCPDKTSIDDIITTANSLESQSLPVKCHFVLMGKTPSLTRVISTLQKKFTHESQLVWNVKQVFDNSDRNRACDAIINDLNKADCNYYLVIDPGFELWESFSNDLDVLYNDKLERFIYLREFNIDDKIIGPLVHTVTHKKVGGNYLAERDVQQEDGSMKTIRCNSIYDKLMEIGKHENVYHLIGNLKDMSPYAS